MENDKKQRENVVIEDLSVVDSELLEVSSDEEIETKKSNQLSTKTEGQRTKDKIKHLICNTFFCH